MAGFGVKVDGARLPVLFFLLSLLTTVLPPAARAADEPPFLALHPDAAEGKLLVDLPAPDADGVSVRALYSAALASGLGSNPLGLDRGLRTDDQVIRINVRGKRVTVEAENWRYRAVGAPAAEQQAVRQSFATSILWAGTAESVSKDGGVTVDMAPFFAADRSGLARALKEGDKVFAFDKDRSAVRFDRVYSFPDNIAVEAELTFASPEPGPQVRAVTPDPRAVTLGVHYLIARLPEPGYQPKAYDPRFADIAIGYYDFAAPLSGDVRTGLAIRHRLKAGGEPIVYYVDPGAPKDIRDALVAGASWWADAFAAAGYPGGYRVEVLPEDANPLDIRYNVIQWVHRQTRGWSYGQSLVDPRTGEIVKGHVILGSQRVRQDRMIFEGLAGVADTGTGAEDDPVQLSLDRIRQLSAHEVGHTLGFEHNFAASTTNRASVMDYPAPWVIARDDDTLDFSRAYDVGIGSWDKVATTWLYGDLPPSEAEALIEGAREGGLLFVADQHARGVDTAHPDGAVWDNGNDPVAELSNTLRVRKIGLDHFGTASLASGRPGAQLAEVLVPIYLYHRYQTASAAKSIGGVFYRYGINGLDHESARVVPPAEQRRAIAAVLETLDAARLDLPDATLTLLTPMPDLPRGIGAGEGFDGRTGETFDLSAAAATAADISLEALTAPARLERMAQQSARAGTPSPADLFAAIESKLGNQLRGDHAMIGNVLMGRYAARLIALDSRPAMSDSLRGAIRARMSDLAERLQLPTDAPMAALLRARLQAQLDRPAPPADPALPGPEEPPGSPIG